ncbi:MAG: hypothetical protein IJ512_05845 [Ruminococcus sp.]|nr:hypothetical protein [Ruminococcus sp.]
MSKDENLKEKLDEIIEQENTAGENADAAAILPLPICISLGASLGMAFGALAKNLPMGLCFGLIGGCAIYGVLAFFLHMKKKKQESDTAEKSETEE